MRKRIYEKRKQNKKGTKQWKETSDVLHPVWRGENVSEERKSFVTRWRYPHAGNMVAVVGAECEVGPWVDWQVC